MKKILASLASILLLTAASSASAKPACATSEEVKALNARVLQTDLMVAALACKQQASYNSFVKKYQSDLIRRSGSVQGYFKRIYGKSGEYQLNKFVTGLANSSSSTSLNMNESTFCNSAKKLFDAALDSSSRDLSPLLENASFTGSGRHGVQSCKAVAQN